MNNALATRQLKLLLRSPVHVGSRVRQLTPLEAVALGRRVYKVHEERLAIALRAQHLLDSFVQRVRSEDARFDLGAFLQQRRLLTAEFLGQVAEFATTAPAGAPPAGLTSFRPCVRGGLGQAYIPGSSIKGALRTALLNARIAAMNESDQAAVQRRVEEQVRNQARREWFAQPVVGDLLQGDLPLGPRRPGAVTREHRDLLRCLKVSDALYTGETVLLPVQVLSLRQGDGSFYLKELLWIECIPAGAELTATLTFDGGLLADFQSQRPVPFADLGGVLRQAGEFAGSVLDEEYAFFDGLPGAEALRDFYHSTDANLRLGWGSGLPATTILLSLPKEQRLRLRDTVLRARRESAFFPKSRRVVVQNREPVQPLGWVRFDPVNAGPGRESHDGGE